MSEAAKIYWGEDRIRMGWFLNRDGKDLWIHGPSICESSGGGPLQAIAVAYRQHGPLGEFEIEVPEHTDTLDRPCIWCEPKLRDVIAAVRGD